MSIGQFQQSGPNTTELSSTINAQKFNERFAAEILNTRGDLAEAIGEFYALHGTADKVYDSVLHEMDLPHGISRKTAVNALLQVINAVVPEDVLIQIRSNTRSFIARQAAQQAKETKRKNGRLIFTDQETDRLLQFHAEFTQGNISYDEIAEAMKQEFDSELFTGEKCRKRIMNVLYTQKQAAEKKRKAEC